MGWYDWFAGIYDASLEALYADARAAAADALALAPGHHVLDVPCGTGQSFGVLAPRVLPGGSVLGVDLSEGMLRRARARVGRTGWAHVTTTRSDVRALEPDAAFDRALVFLGLTAFDDWEAGFERIWERVKPGGRCVIVDVHAEALTARGRMVNLIARADIRRRVWEPLERVARDFARVELPEKKQYGGRLFVAHGTKCAP